MAGSMTAYADFHLIAKWDIKAGEELFMDRTENARFAHPLYYSRIPSVEDYGIVDEMIKGIAKDGFDSSLTEAQFNDLLYRLGKEVLETGYASRAQVLRDIFPRSKQQFERCLLLGTARCGLIKRHLEWIKRKGEHRCTISLLLLVLYSLSGCDKSLQATAWIP